MARWRRGVAALAVAVVASIGLAAPASALDCKGDPPPLQTPSEAPGSNFDPGPANPTVGDPWASPPTSTIYETYGYAGLLWTTYDLGCLSDAARSPTAVVGTWFANALASLYIGAVALDSALSGIVLNPGEWLAPVDAMFERLSAALREPVAMAMVFAILALALAMAWRSDKSEYAETASKVVRLFAVAAVFALLYGYPAQAARAFDSSMAWGIDTAQRGFTGTTTESPEFGVGMTANIVDSVLYETWRAGTFGNGGSKIAMKYAPVIYDSTARTWAEDDRAQQDPEYAAALAEEKGARYKEAAAAIQEASPEAYAHLIGQRSWNRIYYALTGGFAATITVAFSIVAKMIIGMGFIAVRLGVMFGFLLVVLAVLRPDKAIAFAEGVGRILLNGLWFGIAVGGFAVFQGALLRSNIPAWAAALLTLGTAIVFWRLTKAMRRNDPTGDVARMKRFATDQAVQYAERRWAARGALDSAARAAAERDDDDEPEADSGSSTGGRSSAASPQAFSTIVPIEVGEGEVDEPVAALPRAAEPLVPEPRGLSYELEPGPTAAGGAPPEVPQVRSEVAQSSGDDGWAVESREDRPPPVEAPIEDIDGQSVYRVYVPEEGP